MTGPAVVVVGSINEDLLLAVERDPRPGETVRAVSVQRSPGGKGANQAVAAARAGAAVALIGRVGDDGAGRRMLAALEAERVGTGMVRALPGVGTGAAYITVGPGGESTVVVDPGANARLRPADVEAEGPALAAARVVLAQLEVPVDTAVAAVRVAVGAGVRAVVSLAPAGPVPPGLLAGADPLVVNELEARTCLELRGGDRPGPPGPPDERDREAGGLAAALVGLGARSAVVTLGARGAAVADRDGVRVLPAVPVAAVVDTTGAGDAFTGALSAALAGGHDLAGAVGAGLRAAAAVLGRRGAR